MKEGILVLLSSYNGEAYIESQIMSIINQKINCEVNIRIRDDGSCDNTCIIIEKLMEQYPERIELIRGDNIGYNKSFFELFNNTSGYKYYAISDQDDIWLENKLQVALEWMNKEDYEQPLLYASTSYLVKDDMIPYGTTRKKIREFSVYNTIIQNICPGHTQVMNNSLLDLLKNDIDTSQIYVYDSWITNMAMLYGKILFNNKPYTLYRQHLKNQLGYGKGMLGQVMSSVKRTQKGDSKKYKKQIQYFFEKNRTMLEEKGFFDELYKFLDSEKVIDRVKYMFTGKLYRQKKIESLAFYIANVLGKF